MRLFGVVVVAMAGALVVSGCASGSEAAVPTDPVAFSETVTVDAVTGHLEQLEKIAANNEGNRSAGTPGYDASVDYVANLLEDKGFEVSTPEFDFSSFDPGTESLKAADGSDVPVRALTYSTSTGPTGITARLVAIPADETPGCEATDYDGRDVNGAIVLVTRGVCPFGDKQKIAADRGAAALLVANNEDAMLGGATLGEPEDAAFRPAG